MRLSEESKNYGFKVRVEDEEHASGFRVTALAYRKLFGVFWVRVPGGWYFYETYVPEADIDEQIANVLAQGNQWVHRQLVAKNKTD